MRQIIAISLFLVTLLISGFAYASSDQQNSQCDNVRPSYGVNHSTPTAIFAGPKVGWVKVPTEEVTSSLFQSAR
jgi:hypothetical protein